MPFDPRMSAQKPGSQIGQVVGGGTPPGGVPAGMPGMSLPPPLPKMQTGLWNPGAGVRNPIPGGSLPPGGPGGLDRTTGGPTPDWGAGLTQFGSTSGSQFGGSGMETGFDPGGSGSGFGLGPKPPPPAYQRPDEQNRLRDMAAMPPPTSNWQPQAGIPPPTGATPRPSGLPQPPRPRPRPAPRISGVRPAPRRPTARKKRERMTTND